MNDAAIVDDDTLENQPEPESKLEIDDGIEEEEAIEPEGDEPDEPEKAEKKIEFTDEQQRFINEEIIGKKVAKQREAERQLEDERNRREQLEAELTRIKAPRRPEVPPVPDYFDDNYEQKLQARDLAIQQAAEYDAGQRLIEQERRASIERQEQAQAELLYGKVKDYTERADKLGIKSDELQRAGNYVAQYQLDELLAEEILDDDHGPAITLYLAQNPVELEQIRAMRPTKAWAYIEKSVKDNALETQSKPRNGPKPLDNPKGTGFAERRGPKGAVYE